MNEYKRAYINAYKNDVHKRFEAAKRERKECIKAVKDQIHAYRDDLHDRNKKLSQEHDTYTQNYQLSIENVHQELERWKDLSAKVEATYESIMDCCNKQFDQFERRLEHMLAQTQVKMIQASQDKSYVHSFHPQIKRLA